MSRINCESQAEVTAAIKAGNIAVVAGSLRVEARGSAHVVARDSAHVVARDSAHVVARDSAHVEARGSAHVVARDSAHVVARGSAHVVARDSAHVVAWDSAHVVAWDSAHVVARDSAHVVAWDSAHVVAGRLVAVHIHSDCAAIAGGVQIAVKPPRSAHEWCSQFLIQPREEDGLFVLYKATDDDYGTKNDVRYEPGTMPEAPDWDGGKAECGGGLHFSPTPRMAREFNGNATRFVACPVDLSEATFLEHQDYQQKVKVRRVAAPCWEVDIDGKPIERVEKEGAAP